ncbi:MAG TPA: ATP-binding protein [Thermoanaerobaculia bacterium]|nr:ATP-binding protein [Thermoanaerobaculia bacterium]
MSESQQTEWKSSWRDEYLRWICGFANAEGGTLVIGRDDRGAVVGVKEARKLMEEIPNKVRDVLGIMVDVNLRRVKGKDLVEIRVEPYPSPISYKGEYHYRSGSIKQELKGAALERFLLKKRGRHWDDAPEPSFTPRSCSAAALRLFKEKATESGRMDRVILRDSREVVLGNLELTERHGLKRAACLLFSDRPEQYVSGAWIKLGFFVTNDDLRYQDEVHGSLFEQVDKTLELLYTKYLKAYISYQGVQRRETFLFPDAALREALLNAVVHKDYGSSIPIQISVYDDGIVLWNPGGLPESWTLERLLGKHPSCPFNPLLANAFFRAGYIESWGRGVEKIQRECREHGIEPPVYDFGMAGLMLTFRANPEHLQAAAPELLTAQETQETAQEIQETAQETAQETQETAQEIQETTQETAQEKLLALMRDQPSITRRELADRLGLSDSGIKYHLAKMRAAGLIRHVGPTKAGSWEVLGKDFEGPGRGRSHRQGGVG